MRCTGLLYVCALLIALAPGCADTDAKKQDAALTDYGPPPGDLGPDTFAWQNDGYTGDSSPKLWKLYAHDQKKLFVIDPLTLKGKPTLKVVGDFTFEASIPTNERSVNDIAVTPDGRLYAVSKTTLYQVDPDTAKLTKVTELSKGGKNPPPNVSLTFEKSGVLLASDKDGSLVRIHYKGSNAGSWQDIGTYGDKQTSSGDLVAIKDGRLYGVSDEGLGATKQDNKLLKIDPTTGKATPIGSIGHGYVWGLAYWAGVIYGFTSEVKPTKAGKLLRIDPKTGKGTLIIEAPYFPYQFWGAAVTPLAPIQ